MENQSGRFQGRDLTEKDFIKEFFIDIGAGFRVQQEFMRHSGTLIPLLHMKR